MGCTFSKPQLLERFKRTDFLSERTQSCQVTQYFAHHQSLKFSQNQEVVPKELSLPFLKSPRNISNFQKPKFSGKKTTRILEIEEEQKAISLKMLTKNELLSMIIDLKAEKEEIKAKLNASKLKYKNFIAERSNKHMPKQIPLSGGGTPFTFGMRTPFNNNRIQDAKVQTTNHKSYKIKSYREEPKNEKKSIFDIKKSSISKINRSCPIMVNRKACFEQLAQMKIRRGKIKNGNFLKQKAKSVPKTILNQKPKISMVEIRQRLNRMNSLDYDFAVKKQKIVSLTREQGNRRVKNKLNGLRRQNLTFTTVKLTD